MTKTNKTRFTKPIIDGLARKAIAHCLRWTHSREKGVEFFQRDTTINIYIYIYLFIHLFFFESYVTMPLTAEARPIGPTMV